MPSIAHATMTAGGQAEGLVVAEALRTLGSLLPFVAAGVSLAGGLFAVGQAGRGRFSDRTDLRATVVASVLLAVVVGGVIGILVAMIGAAWAPGGATAGTLVIGMILFGIPAFVIVLGSSLTLYAVLARIRPTRSAVAAAILGPVVLGLSGGAAVLLVKTADDMVASAFYEQQREEVAGRSEGLHLAVQSVQATLDSSGNIATVQLRVSVRSDTDLAMLQLPGKLTYPLFVLHPAGRDDPNTEIQGEAPVGSPTTLVAGQEVVYDIAYDVVALGAQASAPGTWLLVVGIGGDDGSAYAVETMIEVRG